MNSPPRPVHRNPSATDESPALFWVRLPFLLAGLAAATYGVVQHRPFYWTQGVIGTGFVVALWLSDRWVRREWPVPTPSRQSMLALKACAIVMPFFLILSVGVIALFPSWF